MINLALKVHTTTPLKVRPHQTTTETAKLQQTRQSDIAQLSGTTQHKQNTT